VSDYFNYLLSGRMANELSIASHSQLLSASEADWSPAALRHFGIPAGWFERPLASPRGLGVVRGLPELKGVKSTLVPGHDTACAFASMPADPAGADLYLSTGTWSLIGCESERPLLGDDALEARISNERMGDGRFRPLRSCLGLWLLERLLVSLGLKPASARDWKALIDAAAATRPPAAALDVTDRSLFSPPDMKAAIEAQLRRRRLPAPKATAGWIRLVLHSLALGHADGVRQFERLTGRTFDRILIVGGGSRNPLLCQATADAAGVPVVSFALEGSAMGNVGSQLIALGELENLAALRHSLTTHLPHRRYTPSAG
jgi:rhamnulokinase